MSTITRIKGVIDNPNLPVISPEGLVNPFYGKYINALAEQGFFLTSAQSTAVKAFVETITSNELADYILAFYPFIGSQSNINGAKVPIFGDKLFDWNDDSFDGFDFDSNGNIIGYNKPFAVPSLKVSDIVPENSDGHFLGVGYSINKTSTEGDVGVNRVLSFSSKLQVRFQGYNGRQLLSLYYHDVNGTRMIHPASTGTISESTIQGAGSFYAAFIVTANGFSRYANMGNETAASRESSYTGYPDIIDDFDTPLDKQGTLDNINQVTSLIFFKSLVSTRNQIITIMEAVKTLMTALGRNV